MNKFWSILTMLFCLAACTGERCIEADDFGFANFVVSARYSLEEMSGQTGDNQVSPWKNSNYRVNGKPLTILVRGWTGGLDRNKSTELSAWCAWYGQSKNTSTLSAFCERLQDCLYIDDQMCTNTKNARIGNAPCIFRKGVGLYALIPEAGTNPNLTFATAREPAGLTFHLGEPTVGYGMYDIDKNGNTRQAGGLVYKYEGGTSSPEDLRRQYVDRPLYFKILDKFYDDNSGQYRIAIKSGVTDTNPDPITYVTNLVKKFLFGSGDDYGLIRNIYTGIINNPGYRMAVSAVLSLYIMWTALSYLAGNVQLTHTELVVRVIKVGIVSALLSSEYSWTFFNDYLFVWFVGGMGQILQMIIEAGATGPGSSSIFGLMIAPQTLSKLFSLLFVDWLGFIYIALFFFALYFVIMIFFDAAVIYLTALIAIGMIIVMGPIFICFLLFGITKSLFENWLKQLISYAIQPLILFTGLVFISMILRQEIYGSLGFRVCKQTFPKMDNEGAEVISDVTKDLLGFDLGDSLFYWWFPNPMKGEKFSRTTVDIPIPIDHYVTSGNNVVAPNDGEFCEAYACNGPRYIDLPFLDPVKDTRRLNQFWNGKFVQLDGMLLIFVAIYLLNKFNGLAVSVAKFITGTSGNLTDISKVSQNAGAGIGGGVGRVTTFAKEKFAATGVGRKLTEYAGYATAAKEAIQQAPSKLVDKARIAGLKKDAVSKNPNKAVIDEVKRSTGLDHKDIKQGAIRDYKNSLKDDLKKMDPGLTDRQARNMASKMSHRNFKAIEGEFAKAKYGKAFKELNTQQQAEIKAIMNRPRGDKSLRELANNAAASREYREAYVDAYAGLSERGVGLVGKRSSTIQSMEELKHQVDKKEELKEAKRKATGEELYAGFENLKHGAYGAVTGGKTDRFGRKFAGGSFNEIDTNKDAKNYRMQTHNEKMAEREQATNYQGTAKRIENLSKAKGESVISPEFIAKAKMQKDPNLAEYQHLERQQMRETVRRRLTKGENPALKGEKYMSEYAKDSEMVQMVDRAEKVKAKLLQKDEFVSREEKYENNFEVAKERILDKQDVLENHFNKKDIKPEEMPALLEQYHKEIGTNPKSTQKAVQELKEAIKEFDSSQQVLQEIDQRKQGIVDEVDRQISGINEHRKKAGMQEYIPPKTTVGTRAVRKIEDFKRGGR